MKVGGALGDEPWYQRYHLCRYCRNVHPINEPCRIHARMEHYFNQFEGAVPPSVRNNCWFETPIHMGELELITWNGVDIHDR